jgi:hypothetical protein
MFGMGAVLDVALGLIFLYMMTSLLVTIVQEMLATALHLRAKNLFDAIENLVDDPDLAKHSEYRDLVVELYRHPLVASLYRDTAPRDAKATREIIRKTALPSYIPSRTFAIALLDVLRGKNAADATGINTVLGGAQTSIAKLPESRLKRTLTLLVADGESLGTTLDQRAHAVSERVEGWFNDSMGRASGWYKRQAQKISIVIAVAIAVIINANTFHVAGELWHDNTLRAQVAATAAAYYKDQTNKTADSATAAKEATPSVAARWNAQMKELDESSLPIGWTADITSSLPRGFTDWLALLFGWLVTGFAASLGATFWFDILGKVLQIRGTGAKVDESAHPRLAPSTQHRAPLTIAAASVENGERATSTTVAVSRAEGG